MWIKQSYFSKVQKWNYRAGSSSWVHFKNKENKGLTAFQLHALKTNTILYKQLSPFLQLPLSGYNIPVIWRADGFAFLRSSSPTQCNTDRTLNEDKHRTYRCAVVIVFAFLDWVTWQAFVSKDSKKSSSALADILYKGSTVKQWCVCTLKSSNYQTCNNRQLDTTTQQTEEAFFSNY